MPDKSEKQRRKEILHALRDRERKAIRDSFPAPILTLKALFDFLDQRLSEDECDHTLRFTREFMAENAIDDGLTSWLRTNGGYCDCEALDNVEPVVADALSGYEQIHSETNNVN